MSYYNEIKALVRLIMKPEHAKKVVYNLNSDPINQAPELTIWLQPDNRSFIKIVQCDDPIEGEAARYVDGKIQVVPQWISRVGFVITATSGKFDDHQLFTEMFGVDIKYPFKRKDYAYLDI